MRTLHKVLRTYRAGLPLQLAIRHALLTAAIDNLTRSIRARAQ